MNNISKNRINLIPASDWFDESFLGDFLYSKSEIKKKLNEQIHKIGDDKLSSRLINHWYESGILDDDRPNGKGWKKFSISELIWISIVVKLRGFGIDLERIKNVKKEISIFNSDLNLSKCPFLDFYIIVSLFTSLQIKFIVFESGEATILPQVEIDRLNNSDLLVEDFISIDLNKLVRKFMSKKNISMDYLVYNDTPKSLIQKEIEDSLKSNELISLTIKVKENDYIIDEEFFIRDRVKANALMNILDYGRLTEIKNCGKSTFQLTNKKKIKKG
jgi:hypothetical protein